MTTILEQITNIFNDEIKVPFHYNLEILEIETVEELFEKIYDIYKLGLCTLFGDNKTIDVKKLNFKKLEKIKKYMLSFGIEVLYYRLTTSEQNNLYKCLLTELECIENLGLFYETDWRSQNISKIELKIQNNTKNININKIIDILNNNKKICRVIDFFNLKKKKNLDDFCKKLLVDKELHVISFKVADRKKYGMTVSQVIKYKYN